MGEADIGKNKLGISLWLIQENKGDGEFIRVSVTSK